MIVVQLHSRFCANPDRCPAVCSPAHTVVWWCSCSLCMLRTTSRQKVHRRITYQKLLVCTSELATPCLNLWLQVDDDVYLRSQLLIDLLPTLPSANLYLGEFVQWWCKSMATAECGPTPPPDTKTRLFMSARYACGGGYLLSADLARAFAAGGLSWAA